PISVHVVALSSSKDAGTLQNTAIVAADNEDSAFFANNQASASISLTASGFNVQSDQTAVEGSPQTFAMGSFTSSNSGTATVAVDWGDSTGLTFNFVNTPNTPVTLPAQTHTYAEDGTYTVKETVTLGGTTKTGTFLVVVSDPAVIAAGVSPINKAAYDGK